MLRSQVVAPITGELELLAILDGLLQDVDALGIRQTDEGLLQHALKSLDERLVDHFVQELQIVLTVIKCPAHAVLDEVLFKVHELFLIDESHLRLNHPELSQMARRVRVLGTERRTEGIDCTESRGTQLALQLSAHCERSLLSEEVVVVDDFSVFVLLQVVEVLRRHLEHVASSLAVAGGNKRRVEIVEAMLMEVGMNGHSHVMAYAHHGSEGVGAQTHVGMLTHILEGLPLLLHGISTVAETINDKFLGLDLTTLTGCRTLDKSSDNTDTTTCSNVLQQLVVKLCRVNDHLHILDGRAIVERNEVDILVTAVRAYPTLHTDFLSVFRALQHVNYLCAFH